MFGSEVWYKIVKNIFSESCIYSIVTDFLLAKYILYVQVIKP